VCFPISKFLFYYLFFSFLLSVPAGSFSKKKKVKTWISELLVYFFPVLAFPYIYCSKENQKQIGHLFLAIWIILGVYFFAIRRLCPGGLVGTTLGLGPLSTFTQVRPL